MATDTTCRLAKPMPLPPEQWPNIDHIVIDTEKPVDGWYSEKQMRLLTHILNTSWSGPGEGRPFLAFANVGLFYDVTKPPVVPDVMLSVDATQKMDGRQKVRNSYFTFASGKNPDIVIEVVSYREGEEDGAKRDLYARIGIPYFIIWDMFDLFHLGRLKIYELEGSRYVPRSDSFFPELSLGLRVWKGDFEGADVEWLRWYGPDGKLLQTGGEWANAERQLAAKQRRLAKQERARAKQAQQSADEERERAEKLTAAIRAAGIDPDSIR